ncbi:hypothetical protein GUITHDRAFT_134447 [Guillardia theta CCMP2712]|uniref:Cilia- and flagella-associated protein 157 n=2 Tax=Guillardia theta TaxID=55529 RepID=L1JTK8_GUITC|nr:hypothetical protein GUITHDRAFT_134447 [Guillardia theta CCMP2712]EKX51535.1 hypothetical protein GUITHDRAFT_134447 [Guillardia theta CCMP2712]|eukprot:XP_005838515.1 hypothetical protein GUITHDRAFT_134447 [Guillardia theta CCMP2712]
MPKKGGKKEAGGGEEPNPFADVLAQPEKVLEFVTIKEKLDKSIKAQQDLQEENKKLKEELQLQQLEQRDLYTFLNKEIVTKSSTIAKLEAQVKDLETQLQSDQAVVEEKHNEEKELAKEITAKLAKEVGRYEKELSDLNVFIEKKHHIEKELENAQNDLAREKKKHEQVVAELERKTVQEKAALRREMELKIEEVKATFTKLTDNQLKSRTKQTMQENEKISAELVYQNKESQKILQKNIKFEEENRMLRRDLELHKQTEAELVKRNHAYMKTIKTLLGKVKTLEGARQENEKESKARVDDAEGKCREQVSGLQRDFEEVKRELEETKRELEAKTVELFRIETLQDELVEFLAKAANEIKEQYIETRGEDAWLEESSLPELAESGWRPEDALPPRLDELNLIERERVLRFLIQRVHEQQASGHE